MEGVGGVGEGEKIGQLAGADKEGEGGKQECGGEPGVFGCEVVGELSDAIGGGGELGDEVEEGEQESIGVMGGGVVEDGEDMAKAWWHGW